MDVALSSSCSSSTLHRWHPALVYLEYFVKVFVARNLLNKMSHDTWAVFTNYLGGILFCFFYTFFSTFNNFLMTNAVGEFKKLSFALSYPLPPPPPPLEHLS